jgi:ferredoxin
VHINDELEKEMNAYPEVDWVEVAIQAIRDCIRDREKCKFYHTIIDRAMSQREKAKIKIAKKSLEVVAHFVPNEVGYISQIPVIIDEICMTKYRLIIKRTRCIDCGVSTGQCPTHAKAITTAEPEQNRTEQNRHLYWSFLRR